MDFIIFFIVGVILVSIEVFLPGFEILGIIGIISLIISWVKTVIVLKYGVGLLLISLEIVLLYLILNVFIKYIKNKLTLKETNLSLNFKSELESFVGKEGIAKTDLKPVGKVIFDDMQVEAISNNEYIEINTKVKCLKTLENKIYVEKLN